VQLGVADCNEPLHASRLPEEYRASQKEDRVFSDVIEALSLFPLYDWEIAGPVIPKFSAYENVWMEGHRKKAEEWRSAAYEWSKLHHRTLVCHKQLCSPSTIVTEYDMSVVPCYVCINDERIILGGRTRVEHIHLYLHFSALRHTVSATEWQYQRAHDQTKDELRDLIPSLIEFLQDNDHKTRSDAVSTYAKLAEYGELRRPLVVTYLMWISSGISWANSASHSEAHRLAQRSTYGCSISDCLCVCQVSRAR
jgi:hypothetical protein